MKKPSLVIGMCLLTSSLFSVSANASYFTLYCGVDDIKVEVEEQFSTVEEGLKVGGKSYRLVDSYIPATAENKAVMLHDFVYDTESVQLLVDVSESIIVLTYKGMNMDCGAYKK